MNWYLLIVLSIMLLSCQGNSGSTSEANLNLVNELAQESADVLASVDEFTIQQHKTDLMIQSLFCSEKTFGACTAASKTKDFRGCQRGFGTMVTGMVTLNFSGLGASTCSMGNINDSVTRIPNFTLQTARGATFQLTANNQASGQVLIRTGANQFQYTSTGVRRRYTKSSGEVGLDLVTQTTNPIIITGNLRSGRTLVSGILQTTNQLTSEVCTFTPNGISWSSSSCNCPTAGTWTVACEEQGSFSISYQSACGEATITSNNQVAQLQLDRCNM